MPTTWLPDPSHYPEQMTPLSATTWFEAIGRGLHEAMRQLRGPFGGFEARTELGWAYEGQLDPEWELDQSHLNRAALELGTRWETEYRPRVHAITHDLQRLRPERPPPEGAAELLDRLWKLMLEQWTVHFLVVIPAQIAVEMLHDRYLEAFSPEDPLLPYRLLDGMPNESAEADRQLWRLAREAERLGVDDVLREYPPETVRDRLAWVVDGRLFLRELDDYLMRFGGRSRWHELSLPREVERPHMTVESIRLFLEGQGRPEMVRAAEAARLERDALVQRPDLADVLPASKAGYALKESHVYHIDYPGLLAVREVLLGFGRRLLAEGRLHALDDVWMLRREELRDAVVRSEREIGALVDERRRDLARGLREGPQPYLGEPPPRTELHAALEKFYGTAGRPAQTGLVQGTGASPGEAEGPARVVEGPEDFRKVQPGDVLVATTTTPAWTPLFPSLAALVTETGGILSHAAIVAREYGIPAVVGADGATQLLPDSSTVHVDGSTGRVEAVNP